MSQISFFRNTSTNTTLQPFGQTQQQTPHRGGYVARSASREPTARSFGSYSQAAANPNATPGSGFGRYTDHSNNNANSSQPKSPPLSAGGRGRSASAAPGRRFSTYSSMTTITNAEANPDWIQEEEKFAAVAANIPAVPAPDAAEFVLREDEIVKFDTDDEPPIIPVLTNVKPFGKNLQNQCSQIDIKKSDDLPPFGSCKKTFGGNDGVRSVSQHNRSGSADYGRPAYALPQTASPLVAKSSSEPKPWVFRSSSTAPTAPVTSLASGGVQLPVGSDHCVTGSFNVAAPRIDIPPRMMAITTAANIVPTFGRPAYTTTTTSATYGQPIAVSYQMAKAVATQTDALPATAALTQPSYATTATGYTPPSFAETQLTPPTFASPVTAPAVVARQVLPADHSNISVTTRPNNHDDYSKQTLRIIHEHRSASSRAPLVSSSTSSSNVSGSRMISQEMVSDLTDSLKQIVRAVEAFGERLRVFVEAAH